MVMIEVFVMLNHTNMYDTKIQLKISLPCVPQIGSCLFLGEEHRQDWANILIPNWKYIQAEYDEYSKIDNMHTWEDFTELIEDFCNVETVMYNTKNKNNPTIHLIIS